MCLLALALAAACAPGSRPAAPPPAPPPDSVVAPAPRPDSILAPAPRPDSVPAPAPPPDSAPAPAPGPAEVQPLEPRLVEPLPPASPIRLQLRVHGRGGLGGSWNRVRPCGTLSSLQCDPGIVPRLVPELLLGAQVSGTIFDRVQVAVDYDGAREFQASNSVRLSYAGADGDLLRRVEVGDVGLALPQSRFLTRGVPTGSWGVRATGGTGPLELQALWAQQGGTVVTREFRQLAGREGIVQEHRSSRDDADFAAGQFFFLRDPAAIAGYPHLDVLALTGSEVAAGGLPGGAIHLYRYTGAAPAQDGSTLVLRAVAGAAGEEAVSGAFRPLREGEDYLLHRSGLWLVLRAPLGDDAALGVAYVTQAGDTVGRLDPGPVPAELELLKGLRATHLPGSATWPLEMRNVYRVSAGDEVDPASVRLVIARGEESGGDLFKPHPVSGDPVPYLRLFGADDELPREVLDGSRLYRPGEGNAVGGMGGLFVVLPTLEPFRRPPPVRAAGLSAEQSAALLGEDANPGIYAAADERARRAAARFRLHFTYTTRSQGAASAIPLGAVGLREGSERVTLGGRTLQRGVDYDVQYEVGIIQLRDAAALMAAAPGAELRVTFEQQPLLAASPRSVAGLSGRYDLGARGEITFLGLSHAERAAVRRPALGVEPLQLAVGGMATRLSFDAPWLDRALDRFARPGDLPSTLQLGGEVALSLPDPGGSAQAYLDDFEEREEISVSLQRQSWRLGSAPVSAQRAESVLPAVRGAASAAALVWQHHYLSADGRLAGALRATDVDADLRVAGSTLEPAVLYLTHDPRGAAGGGWRSLTHVLSASGRDLRNMDALEFYVAAGDAPGSALVIDLGTVSEDAFAVSAAGAIGGVDAHGRAWGLGVLDREWDPAREAWSRAMHDQRGIWDQECLAEPGAVYPLGDARAGCTRGNGLQDTEDLNGNGVLDTDERVFRYVVRLDDDDSPFLVRRTEDTRTGFRLYRVPLDRGAGVNASPDEIHHVRHLRLTLVARERQMLALARLRLHGTRWERRGPGGVVAGRAAGRLPRPGTVQVGAVSRVSDADYVSPPGISDGLQDPAAALGAQLPLDYNERALRIRYQGVEAGSRAEVYRSLDGDPRNLLAYGQIRFWALPRAGAWGAGGEELQLRVGSGEDHHYLYRTRLGPARTPVGPLDWEPEIVVEVAPWLRLRAEAEQLLLAGGAPEGGPLVLWNADSTHAVVMAERGRAPNLAATRELAISVYSDAGTASGEVWIDDLRLTGSDRAPGTSGALTVALRGGDLFRADAEWSRAGGEFRQLAGEPSYRDDDLLTLGGAVQLGRLLPGAGIEAPLTLSHARSSSSYLYLDGSDLRAGALRGVRQPGASRTRVGLRLARAPHPDRRAGGLTLNLGFDTGEQVALYTASRSHNLDVRLGWQARPRARTLPLLGLRWTPTAVDLRAALLDQRADRFRYADLLEASAAGAVPQRSEQRRLAPAASVAMQPFPSLDGEITLHAARDLLPSLRLNPLAGDALEAERVRLAGADLGREAERTLGTRLTWFPALPRWATLRAGVNGSFFLDRNASLVRATLVGGDTTWTPLRSFSAQRTLSGRGTLDLRQLAEARGVPVRGESAGAAGRLLRRLTPLEGEWARSLEARFDRVPGDPGLRHQLLLGDLDGVRSLDGDTATLVHQRDRWSLRTRLLLPLATELTVGYAGQEGEIAGPRSLRDERTREGPNLTVAWHRLPLPRALSGVVRSVSASAGLNPRRESFSERSTGEVRTTTSTWIPARIGLELGRALDAVYRLDWRRGASHLPSSSTSFDWREESVEVGSTFGSPSGLRPLLPEPLGLSLRLARSARLECRLSAEHPVCGPVNAYLDLGERTMTVQLDTRSARSTFGVQAELRDRRSRIGEMHASTRLLFGVFGQFDLSGGGGR